MGKKKRKVCRSGEWALVADHDFCFSAERVAMTAPVILTKDSDGDSARKNSMENATDAQY